MLISITYIIYAQHMHIYMHYTWDYAYIFELYMNLYKTKMYTWLTKFMS